MDASNNSVVDLSGNLVVTDLSNNDVVVDLSNNVVVTDLSSNNILMNRFNLLPPTPLVYPDISGINQYTNILLIENAVPDYQKVVSSVNALTLPIIYSVLSKKNDLLALLQAKFTTIPRIGFFFSSSSGRMKLFLDREPLFVDDETVPYSENLQFILNIITEFQVKNIDFLACDTLGYPNWENYYAILTGAGVTVGASNDKTGNIKYGGDWVLESTSEDVEFVYFTQSIEYYTYLLDSPAWVILANAAATCTSMTIDNSGMYMYVSSAANSGEIGRISLTNPSTDNTVWASSAIQGLNNPQQMVVYNGYLYVSNYVSTEISKISLSNPTGDYNTNWVIMATIDNNPIGTNPCGLAIYNGLLFVVCSGGYDGTGSVDIINLNNPADYNGSWFNGSETAPGVFNSQPKMLAISNGYLYVSFEEGLICRIPIAGLSAPASTIPSPNANLYYDNPWVPSSQGLVSPTSMTIVGNYIYVANQGGTTISKISLDNPTTDYNNNWATTTDGANNPSGIATDRKSIYFGNAVNSSIFQIKLFNSFGCNITGIGNIIGKGSITSIQSYSNSNPY